MVITTDSPRHFRKLDERPRISLLRLPAWVRGYLDEILRFAERPTGKICDTADPSDVAFAIRAQPSELAMLVEAIGLLLAEGALIVLDGALHYADFGVEQKNYEAARKAAQRAKSSEQKENVRDIPGPSRKIREDEIRKSPQPPEAGGRVRKARGERALYENPEERRRIRNRHASDILDGFYGQAMQEAAHSARGSAMAGLVDKVERGDAQRVRLELALPAGAS